MPLTGTLHENKCTFLIISLSIPEYQRQLTYIRIVNNNAENIKSHITFISLKYTQNWLKYITTTIHAALHTVTFEHGFCAGKCILTSCTYYRQFKVDGSMEKNCDTGIRVDLTRLFVSRIYRVIQNDCRSFNNLSYKIHLR